MKTIALLFAAWAVISTLLLIAASLLRCRRCGGWHEEEDQCPSGGQPRPEKEKSTLLTT